VRVGFARLPLRLVGSPAPRRRAGLAAGCALCVTLSCVPGAPEDTGAAIDLEVWYHAGQPGERAALEAQAARFNAMQDSTRVRLSFLPEGSYNAQVQASAVAGKLPDLLDLDGPYVATYAWQGHLRPLDDLLPGPVVNDLLPSIVSQGSWEGSLYGVGTFDSGLALYADARGLQEVGARVPRGPADAWTSAEVRELLDRLAAIDDDGAVIDLKLNYEGEWFTYAFQPALRSAGGGLLDASSDRPVAGGILDSPSSVEAMTILQSWMVEGLVDPNLDDAAFTAGRVALSWSGHWDHPRYREALGDDLLVLPLPDFGRGSRTGQGSWVWTIPRTTTRPEAAAAFLSFLLEPAQVLEMAQVNGAVPGTRTAARASASYGPDGPLEILLRQLEEGRAVPRPPTPAYPFASSIFQDAFDAVRNGEPVPSVLGRAAAAIDREIADNQGYRVP
jgi:multiple sugar transport system substrate-binding protein